MAAGPARRSPAVGSAARPGQGLQRLQRAAPVAFAPLAGPSPPARRAGFRSRGLTGQPGARCSLPRGGFPEPPPHHRRCACRPRHAHWRLAVGMIGTHGGKFPDNRLELGALLSPRQVTEKTKDITGVHSDSVRLSHPMSGARNAALRGPGNPSRLPSSRRTGNPLLSRPQFGDVCAFGGNGKPPTPPSMRSKPSARAPRS